MQKSPRQQETGVGKVSLNKYTYTLIVSQLVNTTGHHIHWKDRTYSLASWHFEPSKPQRIVSGLKTNFNPSPSYSAICLLLIPPTSHQTTNSLNSTESVPGQRCSRGRCSPTQVRQRYSNFFYEGPIKCKIKKKKNQN